MECSICLNAISSTDKSFKTDCNHCFHEQCIKIWIQHDKKSCPNCRHPINQKLLDELNCSQEKKYELNSYNSLESSISYNSLESSIDSQIDHEPELSPGERLIAYMTRS
jgi:hypothetical protein